MRARAVTALILVLILLWPCAARVHAEEEKVSVTVYVAVGGACGGLYLIIAYTTGWQPVSPEDNAFLVHGPGGWRMGVPMAAPAWPESRSTDSIQLLKFIF